MKRQGTYRVDANLLAAAQAKAAAEGETITDVLVRALEVYTQTSPPPTSAPAPVAGRRQKPRTAPPPVSFREPGADCRHPLNMRGRDGTCGKCYRPAGKNRT